MKKSMSYLFGAAVILILTLTSCGAVGQLTAVKEAGDAFMTAFQGNDAASSWDMLTSEVQTEVGSPDAWKEFVAPRNFSDWKFTNTQVNDNSAQLDGEATLGADTYTIVLVFDKIEDSWKISGVNITYKQ